MVEKLSGEGARRIEWAGQSASESIGKVGGRSLARAEISLAARSIQERRHGPEVHRVFTGLLAYGRQQEVALRSSPSCGRPGPLE